MKTAIVFADGMKQIILTPENDGEKQALKYFTPDDSIELAIVSGTFYGDSKPKPFTGHVAENQAGYLRVFNDQDSVMLVLRPKKKSQSETPIQ